MFDHPDSGFILPQEIVDLIVDEVAAQEERNLPQIKNRLRLCSLISKSFRARSREHLFGNMTIVLNKSIQNPGVCFMYMNRALT